MEKNLYIDASHPNETRVVLKSNDNIEDYEYEGLKNNLIKNNIYLGKVSRIEPSLQAAFVDFGRDRHGFLSFNDIQSDYYQIPKSDLEVIKQHEEKAREELSKKVEAKEEENLAEGKLEIKDPLEKLNKLSGFTYDWSIDKCIEAGFMPTDERQIGVFAQDVQSVIPEAVKPAPFDTENGKSKSGYNYLTVQYEKIVPLLIECIKELKDEIDILKNK